MSGTGYIDEVYPFAQLIAERVPVGGGSGVVVETLDYQERGGSGSPPLIQRRRLARRQVRNVDHRPTLDGLQNAWVRCRR